MTSHAAAPPPRTPADLVDSQDLCSTISTALAATPIDEQGLRRGVWTFVGAERDAGTSPGHVIMALTELITAARIRPLLLHHALTRRVILWCVEAYFGHLGGGTLGQEAGASEVLPRVASNR